EGAIAYSIATATEKEIDELNILNATYLAMNRAIEGLTVKADFALIDGNRSKGILLPNETVIGGDGIYSCIAAASILAKVSRDRFMMELAEKYPEYAFEKHKGYGTKLHYERLREHGPSEVHRLSFLKKMH
ncbi:MAG: ribonuclease HII, partial [Oscillospiraceae bacterium]|nr:ribonuclease HII [Oscillospiraceae bacterium]